MFNIIRKEYKQNIIELIYTSCSFSILNGGYKKLDRRVEKEQKLSEAELEKRKELYRYNSLLRTKKEIKKIVFNNINKNYRFITLTFSKKTLDRNYVWRCLSYCFYRVSCYLKRKINYLGVIELHKDKKGYHLHVLADIPFFRNEVFEKKFWKAGFVKLQKIKVKNNKKSLLKIVGYLLKYIAKDIEEVGRSKKRYLCSQGMDRNIKKYYLEGDIELYKLYLQKIEENGNEIIVYREFETIDNIYVMYCLFCSFV